MDENPKLLLQMPKYPSKNNPKKGETPEEWKKYAKDLKEKRQGGGKAEEKVIASHITDEEEFTVQRLASVATGKAMKYDKKGPLEFVPYKYEDVSIENLKLACAKHFKDKMIEGQQVDILASQNGPSCTKLSHIKNFKLIYIRFVSSSSSAPSVSLKKYLHKMDNESLHPSHAYKVPSVCSKNSQTGSSAVITKKHTPKRIDNDPTNVEAYPKSISVSQMLKLGTAISTKAELPDVIEFSEFGIGEMKWKIPKRHHIYVSKESFAKGGFRECFKATDADTKHQYVIKRFLKETLNALETVNMHIEKKETLESLTRKSIQSHMLAKNVAESFEKHCRKSGLDKDFVEFFAYNNAYFGVWTKKDGSQETIMVEDFIEGHFMKYVNNNGAIVHNEYNDLDRLLKAECLAHFSYERSERKFMLLDIQGCGHTLYDPEIATSTATLKDNKELQFCMGNLSNDAIEMFVSVHTCSSYCSIVGLKPFPELSSQSYL